MLSSHGKFNNENTGIMFAKHLKFLYGRLVGEVRETGSILLNVRPKLNSRSKKTENRSFKILTNYILFEFVRYHTNSYNNKNF